MVWYNMRPDILERYMESIGPIVAYHTLGQLNAAVIGSGNAGKDSSRSFVDNLVKQASKVFPDAPKPEKRSIGDAAAELSGMGIGVTIKERKADPSG